MSKEMAMSARRAIAAVAATRMLAKGTQPTRYPGTKRERQAPPPKARKKPAPIAIEYEIENEVTQMEALLA